MRDGDARICLLRQNSAQAVRHNLDEGTRIPLTHGAENHLICAFTEAAAPEGAAVRTRGYAVSLGERDPDTASIAVPVFGGNGDFLGALVMSGPRSRLDEAARTEPIALTVRAAARLSQSITV